jgi:Smg protein
LGDKSNFLLPARDVRGILNPMFEVLVFVYENYWRGDACPETAHLERKLNLVGFDADEIQDALTWLNDLNLAARGLELTPLQDDAVNPPPSMHAHAMAQSPLSIRVYSAAEQYRLGSEGLGFITFLETSGALSTPMRELVLDRAMATPGNQIQLVDLKVIVLMVFWSLGEEPDALMLDELCDDHTNRLAH